MIETTTSFESGMFLDIEKCPYKAQDVVLSQSNLKKKSRAGEKLQCPYKYINEIGLNSPISQPECVSYSLMSQSAILASGDMTKSVNKSFINMTGLGATSAEREMGR